MGEGNFNTFEEFVEGLQEIKAMGWVETHRNADTGVGKTLEDLLGITENNVPGPDAAGVELKAVRRSSGSLTTLFTKEPPRGKEHRPLWSQEMIRELGYTDDDGRPALKVTIEPDIPNSQGFYLNYTDHDIEIKHEDAGTCAIYPIDWLQKKFEQKFPQLVMVFAQSEKRDGREYFHYDEAYHLDGFDGDEFLNLMREGDITVDLRMHIKESGANRNHGTAWRIMDESELDRAFEERTPLLDRGEDIDLDIEKPPTQDKLDDFE
jgi:hypothetical protein